MCQVELTYQGALGRRIRNSYLVLNGTGRYGERDLAQICENPIGDCFNAAFGCHCHSGFGWFQGL